MTDANISLKKLHTLLLREAECYRKVAFPKGGSAEINNRDKQNATLVARGGYAAMRDLAERFAASEQQHTT